MHKTSDCQGDKSNGQFSVLIILDLPDIVDHSFLPETLFSFSFQETRNSLIPSSSPYFAGLLLSILCWPLPFSLISYCGGWSSLLFSVYTHILVDITLMTSKCKCLCSLQINPTAYAMIVPPLGGLKDTSNLIPKTELLIFLPRMLPTATFPISIDGDSILPVAWAKTFKASLLLFSPLPPYHFESVRQYCWLYLQTQLASDHFLLLPLLLPNPKHSYLFQ